MKAKYLFPVMLAAAAAFTSCNDFLEEDPKGRIPVEGFFTSESNLKAAVNALYYNLQNLQCNSNTMIPQVQGDDVTSTSSSGNNKGAYLSADVFSVPTDEKGQKDMWNKNFGLIQSANAIIDNTAGSSLDPALVAESRGQAFFWRATALYNLVQVFGPLPLNLHNDASASTMPLSKVSDVFAQIVSDLQEAEKCGLPGFYTATDKAIGNMNIFVTEQAVKTMLGVAYMSMAGYPLELGQEYYGMAADKFKEVVDGVNAGKYRQALNASWADVYSYGNNYNTEIVLGICYRDQLSEWSSYDSQMSSCHQSGKIDGWGDFLAERYFWKRFPEGPRKDYVYAKQIRISTGQVVDWWATKDKKKYNGMEGDESNACALDYRPMFVGFTVNKDESGSPIAAPYDYTLPFWGGMCIDKSHQLIRYSEVLCWFAECAGRSGKHTAEGLAALQKVQARAYTDPSQCDNSNLAEAAFLEHGWEVAGNMYSIVSRRTDEFRLNRLKEAYDYRAGAQTTVLVPKGTLTHGWNADEGEFTYVLAEDVVLKEEMPVSAAWDGVNSIYQIYPTVETEKNPEISVAKRAGLLN